MSRSDQIIGLTPKAYKMTHETVMVVEKGTRMFPDGRMEEFERKIETNVIAEEVCGVFVGMFDDEYCLHKYTLPDGTVYQEFVQAAPWSSGPCFFLALKDKDGKEVTESLWSQEDIDNA